MDRLCERPGCSDRASVAYGMRAEDLVFWLDAVPDGGASAGGVLCRRHADSMVVPRGWTLDDLRDPDLHLFRPPAPAVDASSSAPSPTASSAGLATTSTSRRRRAERRRNRTADQHAAQLDLGDALAAQADDAPVPSGPVDQPEQPAPPARPDEAVGERVDAHDAPRASDAHSAAGDAADAADPLTPWTPEFDEADDLDGLLAARSPLLARAFRTADRGS